MGEKIKVSRAIAESIEESKNRAMGCWEDEIIDAYISGRNNGFEDVYPKYKWFANYTPFEFSKLILNGYEVVQTPEEQLKKIYANCKYSHDSDDESFAEGIKAALNILGIEIEGVTQ